MDTPVQGSRVVKAKEGYRNAIKPEASSPGFSHLLVQDGQHLLQSVLGLVLNGSVMFELVIDTMGRRMSQSLIGASCLDLAGATNRGKEDP